MITAINQSQEPVLQNKYFQPNYKIKRSDNTSFGNRMNISKSELSAYGCVALIAAGVVDKALLKGKVLKFCPYLDDILFIGGIVGIALVLLSYEISLHRKSHK